MRELSVTAATKCASVALVISCAVAAASRIIPARASAVPSQDKAGGNSRVAFAHALPRLDGAHLKVSVVEVAYGPGESSPPHTHPCPAVGYVVAGAVRMQVKGEPEVVYRAGESFYEAPNGTHLVSANASDKESAKFLAYFVCDRDAPLGGPAAQARTSGGN